MEFPEALVYTKEHEWAETLDDGTVRVGITDFAQDALGDVVYVDIPELGTEVRAGQPFGEVESTKSVSDVYSPVTGTIVQRNDAPGDEPPASLFIRRSEEPEPRFLALRMRRNRLKALTLHSCLR